MIVDVVRFFPMTGPITAVTTYPEVVGCVLALLRKDLKITQSAISETVGVGVSTWSRIENGESALTAEQLALAAQALGVTPGLILQLADSLILVLRTHRGIGIAPSRGGVPSNVIALTGSSLAKEVKAVPFAAAADEQFIYPGLELSTDVEALVKGWLFSQKLGSKAGEEGHFGSGESVDEGVSTSRARTIRGSAGAAAGTTAAAVVGGSAATIMSATAGTAGAALAATAGTAGTAGGAAIASGMAAIGGAVGGGMAAGAVIAAAAPVAAVAALGYGLFKLFED